MTKAGETYTDEYRVIRPDGSVVWIRDESVSMLDHAGAVVLQGVLLDITDRKSVESEMELNVSLLQANPRGNGGRHPGHRPQRQDPRFQPKVLGTMEDPRRAREVG